MKQKKYTIRKISVGILGIIFSISSVKVATANAVMGTDNKVIIDENGVRLDVEPIPLENIPEKSGNKPPVKPTDKPVRKPPVKPEGSIQ